MRSMMKLAAAVMGTALLAGTAFAADRSLYGKPATPAAEPAVVAVIPVEPVAVAMADPLDDPMFAAMRRQMAEMDARMAAMMQLAGTAPADGPGAPNMVVSPGGLPAGSVSYSYTTVSTDAHGCTRTVQTSSSGEGAQPKVVRASSGDCGTEAPDNSATAKIVSAPVPAKPAPAAQPDRRDTI